MPSGIAGVIRSAMRASAAVVCTASCFASSVHSQTGATPWLTSGADVANTRAVVTPIGPNQLNASTVKGLKLLWSFATAGYVSSTPTVEAGGLYVPDSGGMLWKLNPATGAVIWSHKVSDYTGDPNSVSRSSPAIVGNEIIIGDLSVARVMAINKNTGSLIWLSEVDANSDAFASTSPTVYNNTVYFGIASREEALQHPPSGGFRGSVVALNSQTGALLWKFYTVPTGYTGGAVVAAPVVDTTRKSLYIAADNNYSIPASVESCVSAAGTNPAGQLACMDATNYVDSLLSLDLSTGAVKWSRHFSGADTWTEACDLPAGCPQRPGYGRDFASSPNLFWVPNFIGVHDDLRGISNSWLLGAGQKSGYYWGINPANGGVFWVTLVGLGGIQWGSAVDLDTHQSIFAAVKNQTHKSNTLTDFYGNTTLWNGGSWGRLDAATGKLVWQIPAYGADLLTPQFGAAAPGSLTFTNNVVFAGATSGWMAALDARTGYILWKFQTPGSVWGSPAIFNECIYWGTGYKESLGGMPYNKLYAFSFR